MTTTPSKLGADMTDEQIERLAQTHLTAGDDGEVFGVVKFARALLARQPAAIDKEADDDIEEAREILENMVRSIELDGNYSTEATCTFLRQALNCLPVAAPLANEANKPAPSVEQDELLLAAKEVLANGHQHDVGGGDVFVGTCEAAERLQRAVDARAASTFANVARLSMDDLQGKALAHGFKYWRAPDAHGITGTTEQAENLIADLVGVEVEITK